MPKIACPYDADLLGLHRSSPERYPHFLQSQAHSANPANARFDLLMAFPQGRLRLTHSLDQSGLEIPTAMANTSRSADFFQLLAQWQQAERQPQAQELPFEGGWYLYLAYEAAALIETSLQLPTDEQALPIALAERIPVAVVKDHRLQQAWIVYEEGFATAAKQLATELNSLDTPAPLLAIQVKALQEADEAQYRQQVQQIKQFIREGDVFQVNLSRVWKAAVEESFSASDLFLQLAKQNPAPFAAISRLDAQQSIISSSPERLVEIDAEGLIQTRPIAGTRPRSDSENTDKALADKLMLSTKDRAEHVMLIDLERNDLGRVCQPGSIAVNEFMVLESYAHVHHIVSNVLGRLRPGVTSADAIKAVFPGGTITGCPKVRCMEIIAELEGTGRGAYTGSLGYLNLDGRLDLNILIRTFSLSKQELRFRTGAGIVADSDPQKELEETRHKAKGLLRALGCT